MRRESLSITNELLFEAVFFMNTSYSTHFKLVNDYKMKTWPFQVIIVTVFARWHSIIAMN